MVSTFSGGNTMRRMLILTSAAAIVAGFSATATSAKTPKECNAEYATNKDAIKGAGQKKKDFIAACKADTETIPAGTAAAPAPAAAVPAQTATPAPAPAPVATKRVQTRSGPAATGTMAANQFAAEGQATSHCPGQTVVWLNSKSGVYHYANNKNYGHTKAGAYMCEADATAAGERAAKEEKRP